MDYHQFIIFNAKVYLLIEDVLLEKKIGINTFIEAAFSDSEELRGRDQVSFNNMDY